MSSKRLMVVLKLFKKQEDQLAQMLSQLQQQLQLEQNKLQELYDYQQQYQQQFQQQAKVGISGQQFLQQQHFIEQLSTIISQQQTSLNEQSQYMATVQEKWKASFLKRQNFENYMQTFPYSCRNV